MHDSALTTISSVYHVRNYPRSMWKRDLKTPEKRSTSFRPSPRLLYYSETSFFGHIKVHYLPAEYGPVRVDTVWYCISYTAYGRSNSSNGDQRRARPWIVCMLLFVDYLMLRCCPLSCVGKCFQNSWNNLERRRTKESSSPCKEGGFQYAPLPSGPRCEIRSLVHVRDVFAEAPEVFLRLLFYHAGNIAYSIITSTACLHPETSQKF